MSRPTGSAPRLPGRQAGSAPALRRPLLVLLGVALTLAALAPPGARDAVERIRAAAAPAGGGLTVTAPAEVAAGTPVAVTVGEVPDGVRAVRLVVVGSYRAARLTATPDGSGARFDVPAPLTTRVGVVTLSARAGTAEGSAVVVVRAGAPVDPVEPLVGPRTIVADRAHHTMVVVIPQDAWGNPMPDGTPVDLRAHRPTGAEDDRRSVVGGLLAWFRIGSGTVAGRTVVAAGSLGAGGPDSDFLEVAGPPRPFGLIAEGPPAPADGRTLRLVTTSELTDAFGNVVPDGTAVEFRVEGGEETTAISTLVVGGRAVANLRAPRLPRSLRATAFVDGVAGAPLDVEFVPAVTSLPATVASEDGRLVVTVGPVRGPLGGFMPDGTAVDVVVTGPSGASGRAAGVLTGGRVTVRQAPPGPGDGPFDVAVTVAGVTTTARSGHR